MPTREPLTSIDPATGRPIWQGFAATVEDIDQAVRAARGAFDAWADTALETRIEHLRAFAGQLEAHKAALVETISRETGKPRWESLAETAVMIAKVPASIEAHRQRCGGWGVDLPGNKGVVRYKPHGVVAVFGPFNLPGHLPHGHIAPALLAGNTVVFKPSELTPGVGRAMADLWRAAGLPEGVFNLVQGGRAVGEVLISHPGINGVYFTGSVAGGVAIRRALADRPGVILALEMGGNNPLVVHDVSDFRAAAYATAVSAYITAGQRCTCARRLIVPRGGGGDRFIDTLEAMIGRITVGPWTLAPEPFMGPLVSSAAADRVLAAQADLLGRGAEALIPIQRIGEGGAFLTPGLIDVTAVRDRPDAEVFGPMLQLVRVTDFDAAIDEANRTAFGLAAGLLCDRRELYERFLRRVRAGVINWNRQLTNASGRLPFGGVGNSGNHRPSGYLAADYCSYPVASLEIDRVTLPENPMPGFPD